MLIHASLAVESDPDHRRLVRLVRKTGARVSTATTVNRFWSRLSVDSFDLVLVSPSFLREPVTESLAAIRQLPDRPEVVAVLGAKDMNRRAEFLAAGVVAVLDLRSDDRDLEELLHNLISRCRDAAANRLRIEQAEESYRLSDFVSSSPSMHRLLSITKRVAASDTSLLVLGETGVGKEWLARAIHEEGPRNQGPFIAVNLGAIPETLLESELFGHVEGAFTDARRSHRGYFELAHGGTVFLDEVAEMPSQLQSKLLRVLQDKNVRPLGSEGTRVVDVRIIAATSRNLDEEMKAKRFRPDLYYRLGVVTLTIPPLRKRKEDLPELIESYFDHYQISLRKRLAGIQPEAMERLVAYSWPGNVRELMNVIERAVLLATGDRITVEDLPDQLSGRTAAVTSAAEVHEPGEIDPDWWQRSWKEVVDRVVPPVERDYLEKLLTVTGGRVDATARRAGITTRTLYEKMRRYGLRKEDYKP